MHVLESEARASAQDGNVALYLVEQRLQVFVYVCVRELWQAKEQALAAIGAGDAGDFRPGRGGVVGNTLN